MDATRKARIPWGALGALALIVAVEWSLGRGGLARRSSIALAWNWGAEAATAPETAKSQIICVGDSLVKHGLPPALIQAQTGRSAYNLAIPGGPPTAAALVLDRFAAAGGRPCAIVLDAEPIHLAGDVWKHENVWAEIADPIAVWPLACWSEEPTLAGVVALRRWLPSLRDRETIRGRVISRVKGGKAPADLRTVHKKKLRNWEVNRGADVLPAAYVGVAKGNAEADQFIPDPPPTDDPQLLALRAILDRADAWEATVFWLVPPRPEAARRSLEAGGWDRRRATLIASALAASPRVVVLDATASGYPDAAFADSSHLNRLGAECLGVDVGRAIAAHLAGHSSDRIVDLPPFGPRPGGALIEDNEETRLALRAEWEWTNHRGTETQRK